MEVRDERTVGSATTLGVGNGVDVGVDDFASGPLQAASNNVLRAIGNIQLNDIRMASTIDRRSKARFHG